MASMQFPKGKFLSTVKVGEKGQIVIPKGARDLFQIQPGDTLLLMADEEQGIAIVRTDGYLDFARSILDAARRPAEEEK